MKNQKISKESKNTIIDLHKKDRRICDISWLLGIKRQTVQYTIKKWHKIQDGAQVVKLGI